MAKLTKPNYTRGQIFDRLAACFGTSVLGMYDGKLRVEIIDGEGTVIQFSLAPVIHKANVEEEECDELIPIEDQLSAYESAQSVKTASNIAKKDAKVKSTAKSKAAKGTFETASPKAEAAQVVPIEITDEERENLDKLNASLESF